MMLSQIRGQGPLKFSTVPFEFFFGPHPRPATRIGLVYFVELVEAFYHVKKSCSLVTNRRFIGTLFCLNRAPLVCEVLCLDCCVHFLKKL